MLYISIEVCTIPNIDNGRVNTSSKDLYKPGEQISVSCDNNYEPLSSSSTCQDSRTWAPQLECTHVTCFVPPVTNGHYTWNLQPVSVGHMMPHGSSIQLNCADCFTSSSMTPNTCQENRTWSQPAQRCISTTCSALPPNFTNGNYNFNDPSQTFQCNQTIKPLCYEGFYLQNGGDRQCTSLNVWSGELPVCSSITCSSPSNFSHGSYHHSQTLYGYGRTLEPTCDKGYYIANNVTERVCEQKDTWSGETPVCLKIQCSRPQVENGRLLSNADVYNFSMQITIECNKGYQIKDGEYTRTCQTDGTWGSRQLQCDKIICSNTSEVAHDAIVAYPTLAFGEVHEVTVDTSFYVLTNGSSVVNCSWDGSLKWISQPTFGIEKQCLWNDIYYSLINHWFSRAYHIILCFV